MCTSVLQLSGMLFINIGRGMVFAWIYLLRKMSLRTNKTKRNAHNSFILIRDLRHCTAKYQYFCFVVTPYVSLGRLWSFENLSWFLVYYRDASQFFLTTTSAEGRKSAGTTTLVCTVDWGDFSLLTSLSRSEFLIGLNFSTSLLYSSPGDFNVTDRVKYSS